MTMTRTQLLLSGVLIRLQAAFTPTGETRPRFAIELFPDEPAKYRLLHPTGAILVRQLASEYEPPAASGQRHGSITGQRPRPQERTVVLRLTLMFRQLNGRDGVTALLDEVKDALWGFAPDGARGAVWFVADGFVGDEDGIWEHALDIAVATWEGGN